MKNLLEHICIKAINLVAMFTMGIAGALCVFSNVKMNEMNNSSMFVTIGLGIIIGVVSISMERDGK